MSPRRRLVRTGLAGFGTVVLLASAAVERLPLRRLLKGGAALA